MKKKLLSIMVFALLLVTLVGCGKDSDTISDSTQENEEEMESEEIEDEEIENEEDKYDFVFIDAAKSKYPIFLEEALKLTTKNAVIVADNVLFKGYVLSDYNAHKQRTAVRHLREFLQMIFVTW